MKKKRLIPVLLLKNGWLVQSKRFHEYQNIGNPVMAVKRLSQWASDELIYLDISRDDVYDTRREDMAHPNRQSFFEIMEDVAKLTFMPVTIGGKIRSLDDIEGRLKLGADKVSVNSKPLDDPRFVAEAAVEFGSQCIVVSIDAKQEPGGWRVMADGGSVATSYAATEWARMVENEGAGEILLNSVDRDGMKAGYDIDLLNAVADAVHIPVIAMGGVGEWKHFGEALEQTSVDAVAAANVFHHVDQSVFLAKRYLYEQGLQVRPPDLLLV